MGGSRFNRRQARRGPVFDHRNQLTGSSGSVTGSADLTTTGNVSGFAIFRYHPSQQEAVAPLETRNASS